MTFTWRTAYLWRAIAYLAMVLAVLMIGVPIYWLFATAFKTNQEVYTVPPTWLPLRWTVDNFVSAWDHAPFGRFYVNSFLTTGASTLAKMTNAVLCGYAFAYLRFPHKNVIFLLVLMALMIPEEVTVLPNYLTVASLGW